MELPHAFSKEEREAVYRASSQRRDIRRFRSDPIPPEVISNILRAGACAPSVGYMQPTNFILIQNGDTRRAIHQEFVKANEAAVGMFPPERQDSYAKLKLEGILDSYLNICVTCDRSRFGPVVLGRTAQPDMDIYSTVCAVQNLWLAARAEGVGMGWVSIITIEALQRILKLPEHVIPVAYLCVGHTDAFAPVPELKTLGWLPEIPPDELVFYDHWGNGTPENP